MPTTPSAHVPRLDHTIFAHRGLSTLNPENTMEAFRDARDHGARWIETDVDLIADGTPILIHDTQLERTTDHTGSIYALTAEDLPSIDAGKWFGRQFGGSHIQTLADLVDFLNETGINANIEIKQNEQGAARTIQLIDAVAAELARLDPSIQIIVSSFSQPLLMHFHQRQPQYAIAVLYETCALYDDWLSVAEFCGATYIHVEDRGLTREKVHAFTAAGYGVNVYTVNSHARANQLFNWGASGVFTDVADLYPCA
ncbi:glycerophosphodiester phosphodiesterase family protein [Tessaracoccus palaemonis]|uniref:Glycerophosphoryl diester phosphodiesterase n=1 Tax=Tessaracoccus palaemonis TaxID=2829499 RepID=A0ABX8SIU2_9ACTN|nr:glycerophosphodiester phosphodiesterase family protein [Tessaracoccus palaemonis]QXT62794.1 glycerophosphoryl diester phosphodiesterase [Tessaracoccus palaemonis]